jgi:hypothetical protein
VQVRQLVHEDGIESLLLALEQARRQEHAVFMDDGRGEARAAGTLWSKHSLAAQT